MSSLSENVRGLVSLAIVVHLLVVFVGLAGNMLQSPLVERLQQITSPYGQTLNVVPRRSQLQLTHATVEDDDHRLEIRSPDMRRRLVLPQHEAPGGFQQLRNQRLASQIARYVATEDEPPMAMLLQGIGGYAMAKLRVERVTIECQRLEPQPLEPSQSAPLGAVEMVYRATAFRDAHGRTMLLGGSPEEEVAPSLLNQE